MKTLQNILASVSAEYHVSSDEVTDSIRAYLAHLMEDPTFRHAWEEIPKSDALSEEELLLALMIAGDIEDGMDEMEKSSFGR